MCLRPRFGECVDGKRLCGARHGDRQRFGRKDGFEKTAGHFAARYLVLLGFFVLPGIPAWFAQAPVWLAALQLIFLLGALMAVTCVLYKRKLFIKL